MTPLTWICYVWWWVVYVVKKTIRWATRNAEYDPGDLVNGHERTHVKKHYCDGVYRQALRPSIRHRGLRADDKIVTEWGSQRVGTIDGGDNTTGTDNLKRDVYELIVQLEGRLDRYSDEIVVLKTENARLKTVDDQKLNDKFDILHATVTTLSDRTTNSIELLEHRIDAFENQSMKVLNVLQEKIDMISQSSLTKINNLESNVVNKYSWIVDQIVDIENQTAKVTDVSELHERIDLTTEFSITQLNILESDVANRFSWVEDKMVANENQSAKVTDVSELHERIDTIIESNLTQLNSLVSDITNKFDSVDDKIVTVENTLEMQSKKIQLSLNDVHDDISLEPIRCDLADQVMLEEQRAVSLTNEDHYERDVFRFTIPKRVTSLSSWNKILLISVSVIVVLGFSICSRR